jgi:hypothetical protein
LLDELLMSFGQLALIGLQATLRSFHWRDEGNP